MIKMNVSILYFIFLKKDIPTIQKILQKLVKVHSYKSFQKKTCKSNQNFENNIKISQIIYFSDPQQHFPIALVPKKQNKKK